MKASFIFLAAASIVFAQSVRSQSTTHEKYSWYDHITPLASPQFYHYDFDRFGVRWPADLEFSKFGRSYRTTGVAMSLAFFYHKLGFFGYTDISAAKRGNNAEIDLLEEKIIGDIDSVQLSKGNYYHKDYSIALSYPVDFKNMLKLSPIVGWQKWNMTSEVELLRTATNQVLRYYIERKHIASTTLELKVMFFTLFGKTKEIHFSNKQYHTRKGLSIEPAYKVFLGKNLSLYSLEVGVGEFLNKPFNSTIIPFLFLGIGRYEGEVNSTVYRIGVNIRYDLFLLKSGE